MKEKTAKAWPLWSNKINKTVIKRAKEENLRIVIASNGFLHYVPILSQAPRDPNPGAFWVDNKNTLHVFDGVKWHPGELNEITEEIIYF